MDIKDYSKYVLDNMNRATLGNALNIALKFNSEYKFENFIDNIIIQCKFEILENKHDDDKYYKILGIAYNSLKYYKSSINYNKSFIIDDFIIDLWKVLNGY